MEVLLVNLSLIHFAARVWRCAPGFKSLKLETSAPSNSGPGSAHSPGWLLADSSPAALLESSFVVLTSLSLDRAQHSAVRFSPSGRATTPRCALFLLDHAAMSDALPRIAHHRRLCAFLCSRDSRSMNAAF